MGPFVQIFLRFQASIDFSPWLQLHFGGRSALLWLSQSAHTGNVHNLFRNRFMWYWRMKKLGGWLFHCSFWQRTETYCLNDCSENWHIRLQCELAFDSAGNKTASVARIWPSHMNSTYWKCCTHNHTDRYPANWRSYWDFNSSVKDNKLASAWQCCAIQESDNLDSWCVENKWFRQNSEWELLFINQIYWISSSIICSLLCNYCWSVYNSRMNKTEVILTFFPNEKGEETSWK